MKRELTYHYSNFSSQYGKKAFEAAGRNQSLRQIISSGHEYNKIYFPKKGGSHAQEIKKSECRA
jgi:hypothetical protein